MWDLLPVCRRLQIPLVYDIHHHRCNPDGLTVKETTGYTGETRHVVGREKYCHLSSPRNGWQGGDPKPHADCTEPDVPECWPGMSMTVDVEAKAKELAVIKLQNDLLK